ncbi:MAG: hypothetical protein FJ095_00265 [Deltaproteobacteria bacterium]|nr:hypothetical protein [Deltaproteobacteria bacterium]
MRATSLVFLLGVGLPLGLAACGDSTTVIVTPSSSAAGGGEVTTSAQGGAGGVMSAVTGSGGSTQTQGGETATDVASSAEASSAEASSAMSSSAMSSSAMSSSAMSSSAMSSSAMSSSASGGGKMCSSVADCGSASCGWSCTNNVCSLSAKPKFTACYADGGTGASCDGAGSCKVWVPIATVNAPLARYNHSAIWTGSKMIVFGGYTKAAITDTGHSYDPVTDTWTATSSVNNPGPRHNHEALWTGTKMIVWGGYGVGAYAGKGGIYDPATDTWTAMATAGQPSLRQAQAMVYTGSKIIVWGGRGANGAVNTGGVYDIATNTWSAMAASPLGARFNFSYGWQKPTVAKPNGFMFVWGGTDNLDWFKNGALYDPVANSWLSVNMNASAGALPSMLLESATAFPQNPTQGSGFYLFGGWDGGNYSDTLFFWDTFPNALDGFWYKLKAGDPKAPSARARYTGFVLDAGIFLWGGCEGAGCGDYLGDGGVWRPGANGGTWSAFPTDASLAARSDTAGVWTGKTTSEIIIWGGYINGPVGTGARRAVSPK